MAKATLRDVSATGGLALALLLAIGAGGAAYVNGQVRAHDLKPAHDQMRKRADRMDANIMEMKVDLAKQGVVIERIDQQQKASFAEQSRMLRRLESKIDRQP